MNIKRESEHIEFKESLSQLSRALEPIVAMTNKLLFFKFKLIRVISNVNSGVKYHDS